MEKEELKEVNPNYYKKLTIPNVLTVFRMVASTALCAYIAMNGITSPLLITLATIGIASTDAIDGYLARNCGMASKLGSRLDPIADKILNWGLGATLMVKGIMPLWPLIIAARDVSMFTFTSYQYKKNGKELFPTLPAKLKMVFQSAGVVSTLAFGFGNSGLSLLAPIFMGLAVSTIVPEIFCVKDKYFSEPEDKKDDRESNIEEKSLEVKNENKQEVKAKTLEYTPTEKENTIGHNKVLQKTIYKK